jgi:hypothetical protein
MEEYMLYVIRASYCKAIHRTLDKIFIQEEVPYCVHKLMLAMDLYFCLWHLLHLLLITAGKVAAKL